MHHDRHPPGSVLSKGASHRVDVEALHLVYLDLVPGHLRSIARSLGVCGLTSGSDSGIATPQYWAGGRAPSYRCKVAHIPDTSMTRPARLRAPLPLLAAVRLSAARLAPRRQRRAPLRVDERGNGPGRLGVADARPLDALHAGASTNVGRGVALPALGRALKEHRRPADRGLVQDVVLRRAGLRPLRADTGRTVVARSPEVHRDDSR